MRQIAKILYINLAHRIDRKERLISELTKVGVTPNLVTRIEAHLDPLNGHRGCAISHIKALNYALEHNFKNVLILEDDFVFTHSKSEVKKHLSSFFSLFKNEWDVFLPGSSVLDYESTPHSQFKRVLCAQTAHSYLVNNHYFKIIRDCFTYALSLMEEDIFHSQTTENLHAIDHVWKILQPHARWYIGRESIGKQGESFSDILNDQIKRFNPSFHP